MRPVKTRPKFHCDFCSHTSTQAAMEAHERLCWLNPARHCSNCDDTGYQDEGHPCYWCSKLTPDSPAARLPHNRRIAAIVAALEETA